MNKNINTKLLLSYVILLLALPFIVVLSPTLSGKEHKAYNYKKNLNYFNYVTVALLKEDEVNEYYMPYCSGVWIAKRYFLTAYHCVEHAISEGKFDVNYATALDAYSAGSLKIQFVNPKLAKVVDIDINSDLALLEAQDNIPFHYNASLYNTSIRQGNKVHVIGHTSGLSYSYSHGFVAAIRTIRPFFSMRSIKLIQLDAKIYKGNSGGGVFDEYGNLLGISSFLVIESNTPFFVHRDEIMNFLKQTKFILY